jgi:hypothetical protein
MKPYEKNLRAFVKLIKNRGLTALEQTELLQLVQQSENNLEQLANELIKRCQAASLGNELANYRRTLLPATSADLGFSSQPTSKKFPGQPSSPSMEAVERACIDSLRNALQTSIPIDVGKKEVADLLRNAIQEANVLPSNCVPTLAIGNPGEAPKSSEKKP